MAGQDIFVNKVYVSVTESAANTLTFQKIETGYGSLQKTAWIIQRIEYFFPLGQALSLVLDNSDAIDLALCTSNLITSINLASASIIDLMEIQETQKSSVGFERYFLPIARNFADLPGGGLLVLPYPLYLAVKGTSLASPVSASCRISFIEKDIGDKDWMELVQQQCLLT